MLASQPSTRNLLNSPSFNSVNETRHAHFADTDTVVQYVPPPQADLDQDGEEVPDVIRPPFSPGSKYPSDIEGSPIFRRRFMKSIAHTPPQSPSSLSLPVPPQDSKQMMTAMVFSSDINAVVGKLLGPPKKEPEYKKGGRVIVNINKKTQVKGYIRFIGDMTQKEPGTWIGVELDDTRYGKNFGNVGKDSIFVCQKNRKKDGTMKRAEHQLKFGIFVRPTACVDVPYAGIKPGVRVWVTKLKRHPVQVYNYYPEVLNASDADFERKKNKQLENELSVMRNNYVRDEFKEDHDDAKTSQRGVVRFVGETQFGYGTYIGVEMDDGHYGNNFGIVNGVRYFTCKKNMLPKRELQVASYEMHKAQQEKARMNKDAAETYKASGFGSHDQSPRAVSPSNPRAERKQCNECQKRFDRTKFTETEWDARGARRCVICSGEMSRRRIVKLRRKRQAEDKELMDHRLKPIEERKAFGVFVRPDRVVIDVEWAQEEQKKVKKAAAGVKIDDTVSVVSGVSHATLTTKDETVEEVRSGPDARIIPVMPPRSPAEIRIRLRRPSVLNHSQEDKEPSFTDEYMGAEYVSPHLELESEDEAPAGAPAAGAKSQPKKEEKKGSEEEEDDGEEEDADADEDEDAEEGENSDLEDAEEGADGEEEDADADEDEGDEDEEDDADEDGGEEEENVKGVVTDDALLEDEHHNDSGDVF